MRSEDLQKAIDDVLARSPVWKPPAHFARTVSAQATRLIARELSARELPSISIMSTTIARGAVLGFLVAVTVYVAQLVVAGWLVSDGAVAALDAYVRFITQASEQWAANAAPVAWASAALSLGAAAWFTRRIRPFSLSLL